MLGAELADKLEAERYPASLIEELLERSPVQPKNFTTRELLLELTWLIGSVAHTNKRQPWPKRNTCVAKPNLLA
jgi:hypothetical protein